MLVQHYLRRFSRELGREVRECRPEALERLGDYPWPGNVRELQSVLKQALLHATGTVLLPAFLPDLSWSGSGRATAANPPAGNDAFAVESFIRRRLEAGSTDLHSEAQIELDKVLLPSVLRFTNGNQYQAAKILGLARQTLRLRLRTLGLSVTKTVEEEDEDEEAG